MKLATREQVQKIDLLAEKEFGISRKLLIQTAGRRLAEKFHEISTAHSIDKTSRIGIWCGPGNNGNDGKIMAENLIASGYNVSIISGTNWNSHFYDVIVDALFGVGLNRNLEPTLAEKIQQLNNLHLKIISVDLPSGLCANSGRIFGACLKAEATLTLYPPKPGLFLNEGPAFAGKIYSVSLQLPKELLLKPGLLDTTLVTRKMAGQWLPARSNSGNKTSFGHLLIVAGSAGMDGAAALSCEAAARLGCGYVTLCSLSANAYSKAKPDFLQISVQDLLGSDLKKYHAIVFGPGLGTSDLSWKLFQHILKNHNRVLVDADGLNLIAKHKVEMLPDGWILTPHAGELSRMTGVPAADLEADRLLAAQKASNRFRSVVLLKGFRTVLSAAPEKYVIYSGNVALAKAGTGDILSGFIGSLMAQGLSTEKAGALGAYLHGKIADDWVRSGRSNRTLMASDLPERIDATLSGLKKRP